MSCAAGGLTAADAGSVGGPAVAGGFAVAELSAGSVWLAGRTSIAPGGPAGKCPCEASAGPDAPFSSVFRPLSGSSSGRAGLPAGVDRATSSAGRAVRSAAGGAVVSGASGVSCPAGCCQPAAGAPRAGPCESECGSEAGRSSAVVSAGLRFAVKANSIGCPSWLPSVRSAGGAGTPAFPGAPKAAVAAAGRIASRTVSPEAVAADTPGPPALRSLSAPSCNRWCTGW